MARVFLTPDQAQQLVAKFPKTPDEKLALLAYELRGVETDKLAPVVAALENAVPHYTWNSLHVLDQQKVLEHALEEGRSSLVESMKIELEARKNST